MLSNRKFFGIAPNCGTRRCVSTSGDEVHRCLRTVSLCGSMSACDNLSTGAVGGTATRYHCSSLHICYPHPRTAVAPGAVWHGGPSPSSTYEAQLSSWFLAFSPVSHCSGCCRGHILSTSAFQFSYVVATTANLENHARHVCRCTEIHADHCPREYLSLQSNLRNHGSQLLIRTDRRL